MNSIERQTAVLLLVAIIYILFDAGMRYAGVMQGLGLGVTTAATSCHRPHQPTGTGNSLETVPIPKACRTKDEQRMEAWCRTIPVDQQPRACWAYR